MIEEEQSDFIAYYCSTNKCFFQEKMYKLMIFARLDLNDQIFCLLFLLCKNLINIWFKSHLILKRMALMNMFEVIFSSGLLQIQ